MICEVSTAANSWHLVIQEIPDPFFSNYYLVSESLLCHLNIYMPFEYIHTNICVCVCVCVYSPKKIHVMVRR